MRTISDALFSCIIHQLCHGYVTGRLCFTGWKVVLDQQFCGFVDANKDHFQYLVMKDRSSMAVIKSKDWLHFCALSTLILIP